METVTYADPMVVAFVRAVRTGDVDALRHLLNEVPNLATKRAIDNKGRSRTALHVVTDWPGYFPNDPVMIKMLVEAGADPNFPPPGGKFSETPWHWAASSDDVDVAAALIDGGGDLEVRDIVDRPNFGGNGVRTHLTNYRPDNSDLIGGGMRRYTPGKNRKVHRVTVTKNPQKHCLDNGVLYKISDPQQI